MTKPILTVTEFSALCRLLEWCWTSLHQEPELCLADINYATESPDPISTGECGLGLSEAFENTLDTPDHKNIHTVITTLMYKLNANSTLANGKGNTWDDLKPLVDLDSCKFNGKTYQSSEGYVVEDIGRKNKVAKIKEHYNSVNDSGMVEVGDFLIDY